MNTRRRRLKKSRARTRVIIDVANASGVNLGTLPVRQIAVSSLRALCSSTPRVRVNVALVTRARMRSINLRLRGKRARDANVLALRYSSPGIRAQSDTRGEIFIAPAVVKQEARALGVPWRAWCMRMVVHGCAHVAGLTHSRKAARKVMEHQERALLVRYSGLSRMLIRSLFAQ